MEIPRHSRKHLRLTAEELGADVQTFSLNNIGAKGYQGCGACKTTTDHCIIKDGLTEVLEAVTNADVLVAATPIYFTDISFQFKIFVDRCYARTYNTIPKPNRLAGQGKKFVLTTAQNRTEDLFAEVCDMYLMIFKYHTRAYLASPFTGSLLKCIFRWAA